MGLASYRKTVSETKRAAILKAARENFLKDGFSRAAMAEIAKDADVSTATLYKHFASKDALFAAVVHESYGAVEASLFVDLDGKSARDVLLNSAAIYMRQQFDERMNDLLRVVIAEVPTAPQLAADVYMNGVLARYRQFEDVLKAMIARGELKPHDTNASARYLVGMVKEFAVWPGLFERDFKRPEDLDAKIGACIDAFLEIYAARPAARLQEKTSGT